MKRWFTGWGAILRRDAIALVLAVPDPRVPVRAKLVAAAATAYAVSPADIVPDVVPILGAVDDIVVVPAALWLAIHLIPGDLMTEFRLRATRTRRRVGITVLGIVVVWAALLTLAVWWVFIR